MCTANRVTPYPICLRLLLCGSGRAFRALHPVLWFFKLPIASISVHFRMQRSVTAASRAFISSVCAFSSDIFNHKAKNKTGFSSILLAQSEPDRAVVEVFSQENSIPQTQLKPWGVQIGYHGFFQKPVFSQRRTGYSPD